MSSGCTPRRRSGCPPPSRTGNAASMSRTIWRPSRSAFSTYRAQRSGVSRDMRTHGPRTSKWIQACTPAQRLRAASRALCSTLGAPSTLTMTAYFPSRHVFCVSIGSAKRGLQVPWGSQHSVDLRKLTAVVAQPQQLAHDLPRSAGALRDGRVRRDGATVRHAHTHTRAQRRALHGAATLFAAASEPRTTCSASSRVVGGRRLTSPVRLASPHAPQALPMNEFARALPLEVILLFLKNSNGLARPAPLSRW